MSAWTERISPERIVELVGLVRRASLLDPSARSFVVHDLDLLDQRVALLREAFPDTALHSAAIKANPVVELLRGLVAEGMGLEAASLEEIQIARRAGCAGGDIVFDSPVKTPDEIDQAMQLGVTINVDNLDELHRVIAAPGFGASPVGVRVNPNVGAGSIATTSVADRGSRFGISTDDFVGEVVPLIERYPAICGLHVHVGSQGVSLEQLLRAQEVVADLIAQARRVDPSWPAFVDIGGGLPTAYSDDAAPPDLTDYARCLRERAPVLFDGSVRLVTEFGRALLANTAVAVSRIEYVKRAHDRSLIVNHLGADFLVRTAYRPEDWPHEFTVLAADGAPLDTARSRYDVMGPLCFAGDVVGRDVELPAVEPGDLLVIRDVGAYTTSMWSRHCNRGIPPTVGVRPSSGEVRLLLAGERADDVAAGWDVRADRRAVGHDTAD